MTDLAFRNNLMLVRKSKIFFQIKSLVTPPWVTRVNSLIEKKHWSLQKYTILMLTGKAYCRACCLSSKYNTPKNAPDQRPIHISAVFIQVNIL